MKGLSKIYKHGSGNSQIRVPKSEMIDLNNQYIFPEFGKSFIKHVVKTFNCKEKVIINFSNRNTSRTWGSVSKRPGVIRINIYRHSVWVILHELGHVVTSTEISPKGRRISHGKIFGKNVEKIYEIWNDFNKVK